METRTFQAREIREALALVRRELGPDAVIVETKRVPGRALGLLGGSFFEVTAAPVPGGQPPAAKADAAADPGPIRALLPERRAERFRDRPARAPVREMIESEPQLAVAAAAAPLLPHAALRRRLLAAMVPRDLCEAWLRGLTPAGTVGDPGGAEAGLRAALLRLIGPPVPLTLGSRRVAALIGPTGVGKTTTVAKLAAHATLVEGRRVALVSLDDGRIGGTAALRAYASLLELPIIVAPPLGLAQALAQAKDAELVIVDTPGLSPAHPEAFAELGRRVTRAGEPVATHLCVAAATRSEELERIAHLYRVAEPAALLVTKVDEAIAVGSAVALRVRADLPLSFLTTGPSVPDDLRPANPEVLVDLLLGATRA